MNRSTIGNQVASGINGLSGSLGTVAGLLKKKPIKGAEDTTLNNKSTPTTPPKTGVQPSTGVSEQSQAGGAQVGGDPIPAPNTSAKSLYQDNSEQIGNISQKIDNDRNFMQGWNITNDADKSPARIKLDTAIMSKLNNGGDSDADV